jgi:tripartite ATP-independent transporter DctP family solute receptor
MRIRYLVIFRTVFLLLVAVLLSQCQQKKDAAFVFKAGLLVNEEHTWFKAFEHFKENVEEQSKGRIRIEVYPSEQLGKEIEAIRLIQAGVIDMTITSSTLSNWTEILTFCELPFFLKDSSDMIRFIASSTGRILEESMIKDTGLRALGYFQRGERHLTSNRPIKHPDDLKGLIIRVPNVPSFVTTWRSLGAKPTPMSFSEVFTSLQQGTIEAQENPFAMIKNAGFAEVQKYINLTGHVYSWAYPVLGEKQFQSLPKDLKKIVLNAGKQMQYYEHELFLENGRKIQAELKAAGMEFIEVDKNAFIEKSQEAIYNSLSKEMQLIYKQVKEDLR